MLIGIIQQEEITLGYFVKVISVHPVSTAAHVHSREKKCRSAVTLSRKTHLSSLQTLKWGHPEPVSFLNVNNLLFVLALASLFILLNEISLVHQVYCNSSILFLCVFRCPL
jgi:hypothetical protein